MKYQHYVWIVSLIDVSEKVINNLVFNNYEVASISAKHQISFTDRFSSLTALRVSYNTGDSVANAPASIRVVNIKNHIKTFLDKENLSYFFIMVSTDTTECVWCREDIKVQSI